jgi:4'-phosphopantetheinyl transferase
LLGLPSEQRGGFNCWTRKEAYIKAQGLGLLLSLESFDVSLDPDQPVNLRATRPDPQEADRWTLLSLEVSPDYAAALAVESASLLPQGMSEGQSLEFRFWDWNAY